ncbi:hypothetical protein [Alkalihalophilus marmarensis]|uniref:Uncharacterized protein n=1 Tax=Alkalihalophilus marmarensis DSM 21297 TaxID=1188261 RepID=U6SSF8_9BACI|nr:hypothetical protein [Alkalihalophilus marmarensis]ERN54312.1 hypothetical protein A33I_07750 [Alkalihalophilus marmarensis DSM 21297]
MGDWTNLDPIKLSNEQKDNFIDGLKAFADIVERMEKLREEELEEIREILGYDK